MNKKNLLFLALSFAFSYGYCDDATNQEIQIQGSNMHHKSRASKREVFGEFPQGLIAVWQAIWKSNLHRSYTRDFEVYRSDFDPQKNPQVKVYIAIDR